ncbi:hypothetical protein LXA43DRAFT_1178494 [Ganoderma leucocontextum]|nr:hypothetical protein LXA43DRAFT_1178494 [Ganoderma leucocontextum]
MLHPPRSLYSLATASAIETSSLFPVDPTAASISPPPSCSLDKRCRRPMPSPNHVITAPPLRRSPAQGDPSEPWQSFLTEVQQKCDKDPMCWYKHITAVDGSMSIQCKVLDASCFSWFFFTASVIYTDQRPPVSKTPPPPPVTPQTISASSLLPSNTDPSPTSKAPTQSSNTTSSTSSATYSIQSSQSDRVAASADEDITSNIDGLSTRMGNTAMSPTSNGAGTGTRHPCSETDSLVPSAKSVSTARPSNDTGAIVGGVIGGLVLLAFIAATAFFIIRRRRKSGVPPSAEFMHMTRGGSGKPAFATLDGNVTVVQDRFVPLARQSSVEDDEPPPDFTPGSYTDPVLEKVHVSAALRDRYGGRDERDRRAY